jgi:hypothetical protein
VVEIYEGLIGLSRKTSLAEVGRPEICAQPPDRNRRASPSGRARYHGERDTIVPARRSQPVIEAAQHLVYSTVVSGAGHNELYDAPQFATAMRQAIDCVVATGS